MIYSEIKNFYSFADWVKVPNPKIIVNLFPIMKIGMIRKQKIPFTET